MTAVGKVNQMGPPALSREGASPNHYHISAPKGLPGGSWPPSKYPPAAALRSRGQVPAECHSLDSRSPRPHHTQLPERAAPAPGPAPCKAWGKESTVPQMTPAHGAEKAISPWPSRLPSNAELTPNYSPNSKGVKCHRGAQLGRRQANGNFQLRSPDFLTFPSPLPHAGSGPWTCQPVPTPACRVRSRHAQAETAGCPAGAPNWGSRCCPTRAEFSATRRWAPARPPPRAFLDPRRDPTPRPHDGRAKLDPGPAHAPPAHAGDRRGWPAGGREGPRD